MRAVDSIATYFGRRSAPLFGVLSVPADREVRAGVLICPSVGKEHAETTRGLKLFAEQLAAQGFAVLRFDYANTGESAGDQSVPEAVDNWLASIEEAADWLRSIGVPQLIAVGHRVGALLLSHTPVADAVDALVIWDPVEKGRRFLRVKTALLTVVTVTIDGSQPPPSDLVYTAGQTLHPAAAAAFAKLSLPAGVGSALRPENVLTALRDSDQTSRFAKAMADRGVQLIEIADQTRFLEPSHPSFLHFPTDEFDRIASWIDQRAEAWPTAQVEFVPHTHAVVGQARDGRPIVTRVHDLDTPDGPIMVWDTAIEGTHESAMQVVISHSLGQYPRTGPSRLWYEVVSQVAERGGRGLRYDRPTVGESGRARLSDGALMIYDDTYRRGSVAVPQSIELPPNAAIVHTGICAGAWAAAHGALAGKRLNPTAETTALLVNAQMWRLDPMKEYRAEDFGFRETDSSGIGEQDTLARQTRRKLTSAGFRSARYIHMFVPRPWWSQVAQVPMIQLPDVFLRRLADRSVDTRLVFGPVDLDMFRHYNDGPEVLRRASRPIRMDTYDMGDHTCYHVAAREAIVRNAVTVLGL
ncbi:hypothetical protein SKPI104516_09475 [Skermania piniformis]